MKMVFVKKENTSEPETWRIKHEEPEPCRIKKEEPETWRIKHEEPETWRIKHEEPVTWRIRHEDPETWRIKHEEPETWRLKHEEPETWRIKNEEQGGRCFFSSFVFNDCGTSTDHLCKNRTVTGKSLKSMFQSSYGNVTELTSRRLNY